MFRQTKGKTVTVRCSVRNNTSKVNKRAEEKNTAAA